MLDLGKMEKHAIRPDMEDLRIEVERDKDCLDEHRAGIISPKHSGDRRFHSVQARRWDGRFFRPQAAEWKLWVEHREWPQDVTNPRSLARLAEFLSDEVPVFLREGGKL